MKKTKLKGIGGNRRIELTVIRFKDLLKMLKSKPDGLDRDRNENERSIR